jgi:hypothetical protein
LQKQERQLLNLAAGATDVRENRGAVWHLADDHALEHDAVARRPEAGTRAVRLLPGQHPEQGTSGLGLAAQEAAIGDYCERRRWVGWAIAAADGTIDLTTPQGRAMAGMATVFAQLEAELISERTKAALKAAQQNGVTLGRPPTLDSNVMRRIVQMRGHGMTLATIADRLNVEKVPTAHGGARWYPATVAKILARHDRQAATR